MSSSEEDGCVSLYIFKYRRYVQSQLVYIHSFAYTQNCSANYYSSFNIKTREFQNIGLSFLLSARLNINPN